MDKQRSYDILLCNQVAWVDGFSKEVALHLFLAMSLLCMAEIEGSISPPFDMPDLVSILRDHPPVTYI